MCFPHKIMHHLHHALRVLLHGATSDSLQVYNHCEAISVWMTSSRKDAAISIFHTSPFFCHQVIPG